MASFASSYIPTSASQVTRAADNASMIGNNFARWYNQTEGTLFAQVSRPSLAGSDSVFAALTIDGSANNTYELYKAANSTDLQLYMAAAGVFQAGPALGNVFSANVSVKTAGVYKTNDVVIAASARFSVSITNASEGM